MHDSRMNEPQLEPDMIDLADEIRMQLEEIQARLDQVEQALRILLANRSDQHGLGCGAKQRGARW